MNKEIEQRKYLIEFIHPYIFYLMLNKISLLKKNE